MHPGRPAGLTALKSLLEASTQGMPIEAELFEAQEDIGGTFQYRSYDNAELVSSRQLTSFSDFRFPEGTPDHVSLPQYVEYLRKYATHFGLWSKIKLGARVLRVEPISPEEGKWRHRVTYKQAGVDGKESYYDCSHVAISTGLHVEPNIPVIPGIENIHGPVFHSAYYKTRSQLGKNVMILGCGETAMGMPTHTLLSDSHEAGR
jgi:dimethylaniline monooxygenase (N-oxide forming)